MKVVGVSGKRRRGKDTLGMALASRGYHRVAFADALKRMANDYFFCGLDSFDGDKTPSQRTLLQRLGTENGRDFWRALIADHPEIERQLREEGYRFTRDLWLLHFERALMVLQSGPIGVGERPTGLPHGESHYGLPHGESHYGLPHGESHYGLPHGVYAPDVRFPNEAECIHALGGCVVRVVRDGDVGVDPETGREVTRPFPIDLHPSETALDGYSDFDYVIYNDGSVDDLKRVGYWLVDHNLLVRRDETAFLRAARPGLPVDFLRKLAA